ncbi:MAG: trigger factor [Elusimicrobiota bacterium]
MAIWTPSQKTKTKELKKDGCRLSYEVEVPALRIQEEMENVFLRLQLQAKISGYRQGKAPLELIKRQYGGAAHSEAAEQVIRKVIPEVIKDLDLRPIAVPEVGELQYSPQQPLKFELHVETAPSFTPTGYKGIAVTRKETAVKDEEVEARLKQLQDGNARLEKADSETVGNDHYVVMDFEMLRDGAPLEGMRGKNELVDMSSDQTVDGLTASLLGMKRQETKEFEVKIDKKPAVCKATVHEIKVKILPKLDEEFAKDMGLESLAKLKSELTSIIEKENAENTERDVSAQIEQALLKANSFEVPPSLVESQLKHMMARLASRLVGPNQTLPEKQAAELGEKLRPQAADQVRLQFILNAIANEEKIEATDEDFKQEQEKAVNGAHDDKEKEKAREFFAKNGDDIRAALKERKVIQLMRDTAKTKVVKE